MVSSGSGDVECSVGSIVWVRRRNGSWWPGKILGPEELSATHLMSPRSGTPVKLLGREDASVDWYNLEKSKRVKAFRCGEFDECIERAESSLGMPSKKREKYARREDAILHALELEKQMLQMEQRKLGIASDSKSRKFSDSAEKELIKSSESLPCDNGKFSNAKPHQLSTGLDLSLVGEKGGPLNSEKAEEGNQLRLEDDNTEAIPRMRGLRDFGLRTAPSKRKFSSVTSNGSHRPAADDHAQTTSYDGVSMGGTIHANIKNAVDKRRRLNEGLAEDVLAKRRDKCRPLVQVLQSSSKLQSSPSLLPDARTVSLSVSGEDQMGNIFRAKRSRCLYLPAEPSDSAGNSESTADQVRMSRPYTAEDNCPIPGSLMEANTSRFSEDEESDSSETEDMETDSDAETNELSDAAVHSEAELRALGGSDAEEKHERMSNEELDNAGVSKWQMKGKRNVRYLNRKLGVVADGRRASEHSLNFNNRMDGFSNGHEADIIDDDYKMQMARFGNRGNALASKASPFHQNRIGHDIIDWEDLAWEDQPYLKGYLEDAGECLDPVFAGRHNLGGRVRTSLIDVDLKVQASYKKEHVPIVSLMSKLDGKAIIGHPIQIEALREGSSQILLSEKNDLGNEATEGDATLPSVWRTARRTANYRVPRSHPSSALDSNESTEHHRLSGPGRKPPFKKLNAWSNSSKGSPASKDLPHIPRAPVDGRLAGKLSKKVSLSSSQKTRTLSSIVIQQKLSDPKHDSDGFPMDGLIQSDSGPTTVACIPVKLVFSRLYEAVGRPPSGVGNNEVIIKKNSETNPI